MKLTDKEKTEIAQFVAKETKYRETYHEVYDHVLNAVKDKAEPFALSLVKQIIADDFKGTEGIAQQEKDSQKFVTNTYFKYLLAEMGSTFRPAKLWVTLLIASACILVYFQFGHSNPNMKAFLGVMYVYAILPMLFMLFKRYWVDRFQAKPSIRYDFMHKVYLISYLTIFVFRPFIVGQDAIFKTTALTEFKILLVLFFVLSIFMRAFIVLYNKKISVTSNC